MVDRKKSKVIVGMSGGVDSAVAAYILKSEGYDVIGVTLRVWQSEDGSDGRCCDIDDARLVAYKLGIPYYPINCTLDFRREVVEPFTEDYIAGRTPNPCILCNRYVKWEKMLYYKNVLGADFIATGHYANVVRLENGRYTVKKALHADKDQAYMLYDLTQEQLGATLMPLGNFSKSEVRRIAEEAELPVASKPDSQEVCFVTDGSYGDFIRKNAGEKAPESGFFVDVDGNVIGRHEGIINYTVGQRKGLGIALGYPAYVKEIRKETNEVVIGREDGLFSSAIICRDVNFMSIEGLRENEKLSCSAKIRYRHPGQAAFIEPAEGRTVKVTFKEPVRAAAPGQSAVFYDGEGCVIGGGVISAVLR